MTYPLFRKIWILAASANVRWLVSVCFRLHSAILVAIR
jgi:hypothetical protein